MIPKEKRQTALLLASARLSSELINLLSDVAIENGIENREDMAQFTAELSFFALTFTTLSFLTQNNMDDDQAIADDVAKEILQAVSQNPGCEYSDLVTRYQKRFVEYQNEINNMMNPETGGIFTLAVVYSNAARIPQTESPIYGLKPYLQPFYSALSRAIDPLKEYGGDEPQEKASKNLSGIECPRCGFRSVEDSWRCSECYFEFDVSVDEWKTTADQSSKLEDDTEQNTINQDHVFGYFKGRATPFNFLVVAAIILSALVVIWHWTENDESRQSSQSRPKPKEPSVTPPAHGHVERFRYDKALAPLEIRTDGKKNYLVKINRYHEDNVVATVFVQKGRRSAELLMPLGSYRLKYAAGDTWYGGRRYFGEDTIYSEALSRFDFTQAHEGYSGYTVELVLQTGGNLSTKNIDAEEF